jgi:hypothetical protein
MFTIILFGFVAIIGILFFEKIITLASIQNFAYTFVRKPNPNILPPPPPVGTPTPTPPYLPPGKQTYAISGGAIGPKITSLTIDPLDATKNTTQTLRVTIQDPTKVSRTTITIFTDAGKTTINLSLNDSTWMGTWKLPDTVNKRYIFRMMRQTLSLHRLHSSHLEPMVL